MKKINQPYSKSDLFFPSIVYTSHGTIDLLQTLEGVITVPKLERNNMPDKPMDQHGELLEVN